MTKHDDQVRHFADVLRLIENVARLVSDPEFAAAVRAKSEELSEALARAREAGAIPPLPDRWAAPFGPPWLTAAVPNTAGLPAYWCHQVRDPHPPHPWGPGSFDAPDLYYCNGVPPDAP